MNRIKLTLFIILMVLSDSFTSCGLGGNAPKVKKLSPNLHVLEYFNDGEISSYFELLDSTKSIIESNKNVAIAHLDSASDCFLTNPEFSYPSMQCSLHVTIDSVLKGKYTSGSKKTFTMTDELTVPFTESMADLQFLLYARTDTSSNLTVGPGCYSFSWGYYIKDGFIYNDRLAYGHKIPLQELEKQCQE